MPVGGSPIWWKLVSTIVMGVGIGVLAQPQLAVRFMTVKSNKQLNRAVLSGGIFILMMTGVAFTVGALTNVFFFESTGSVSLVAAKASDNIIPEFIKNYIPEWFGAIFLVTLLAAAMSTLNSQFHTMGAAAGRDFVALPVSIIVTLVMGLVMKKDIEKPHVDKCFDGIAA